MQYIGFDIHKRYTFYTQMDGMGQIQRQGKLTNSREALAEFFGDVAEPARVVIEASMNWYHLYDLLEELDIPVTLAHPLRTRAIAEAKVKTDKVDSTILAHLLRTTWSRPRTFRRGRFGISGNCCAIGLPWSSSKRWSRTGSTPSYSSTGTSAPTATRSGSRDARG